MSITSSERRQLWQRGYEDPVWFAMFYFPHWVPVDMDPSKIPWVHKGMLALLTRRTAFLSKYSEDLPKIISNFTYMENGEEKCMFVLHEDGQVELVLNKYTAVMIPRGYAKTTMCNIATLWNTVYEERKFSVYTSESGTHATTQLNSIKGELASNARLVEVFGTLKPERNDPLKWTDDFVQCTNGVTLAAKGRGAQIRGMNVGGQRPDNIILDDVEDAESVRTPEQRLKAREWLYGDVLPALPRNDPTATLSAFGTLLHDDALLMTLSRDPRFHTVRFGATDKQSDALWPEVMPLEKIEAERKAYAGMGMLGTFMKEYFSVIRDEDSAKFKKAYLRWAPLPPDEEIIGVGVACDPAISDKVGADFFGLAIVAMLKGGRIWLLDVYLKRGVTPRQQVDLFFAFYRKAQGFHANPRAGVEAIAYQAALVHLLREEMFREKLYFEIEEIRHGTTKKHDRVEGVLQPRYAAGYINHLESFHEYEAQLLDWPNGKKDGPDVVAMAITLLDPYAAAAADPSIDLAANEYEPLDDLVGDGWAP